MTTEQSRALRAACAIIGVAMIVVGLWSFLNEPHVVDAATLALHQLHYRIEIALVGLGFALLPSVPELIASAIRVVGGAAVDVYRSYKNANGPNGTSGGGNAGAAP